MLYVLNTIALVTLAVREVCRPIRALTWIAIGLLLPILGFILYWALSRPLPIRRQTMRPANHRHPLPSGSRVATTLASAMERMTGASPVPGAVQILTDGMQTYDTLMGALRRARRTIDIEYYIYRNDNVGKAITDILIARAKAGVRVRFLRDGWGSRSFPQPQIARMESVGIECRTFFPLRFPWVSSTLNHRDHCKIVVVDSEDAFVGGINVGDEYTGHKPGVGPWRDTHLRVTGDSVPQVQGVFAMNWGISKSATLKGVTRSSEAAKRPAVRPQKQWSKKTTRSGLRLVGDWFGEWGEELGITEDARAFAQAPADIENVYLQTIESGPDRPAQSMRNLFFLSLTQATRCVDITTPYFLPDADITVGLKTAVAKGVAIRLLVPRHPDSKIIGLASQTYYKELLEAGIQIHLHDKGILHAKVMTLDGDVSIVGAANYDLRSFRLNYEVGTVMYSQEVTQHLTQQFEQDLLNASRLMIEDLFQKPVWTHALEHGARLLAPLL